MHINMYIYIYIWRVFEICPGWSGSYAISISSTIPVCPSYFHVFPLFQVAFVGGFQVVSSADGLGLAVKDAIVDAAKAGKIAEECRDAKGLAEGRQTRHDGSLEPLVYLVGCLDCPLNSS